MYAYSLACFDECFLFAMFYPGLDTGPLFDKIVYPFVASSGRALLVAGPRFN